MQSTRAKVKTSMHLKELTSTRSTRPPVPTTTSKQLMSKRSGNQNSISDEVRNPNLRRNSNLKRTFASVPRGINSNENKLMHQSTPSDVYQKSTQKYPLNTSLHMNSDLPIV